MSTIAELFAPRFLSAPVRTELPPETHKAMADDMGADSLRYMPVNRVAECIGFPESELCMACLTGQYPTEAGRAQYQQALKNYNDGTEGRTYELEPAPK